MGSDQGLSRSDGTAQTIFKGTARFDGTTWRKLNSNSGLQEEAIMALALEETGLVRQ